MDYVVHLPKMLVVIKCWVSIGSFSSKLLFQTAEISFSSNSKKVHSFYVSHAEFD